MQGMLTVVSRQTQQLLTHFLQLCQSLRAPEAHELMRYLQNYQQYDARLHRSFLENPTAPILVKKRMTNLLTEMFKLIKENPEELSTVSRYLIAISDVFAIYETHRHDDKFITLLLTHADEIRHLPQLKAFDEHLQALIKSRSLNPIRSQIINLIEQTTSLFITRNTRKLKSLKDIGIDHHVYFHIKPYNGSDTYRHKLMTALNDLQQKLAGLTSDELKHLAAPLGVLQHVTEKYYAESQDKELFTLSESILSQYKLPAVTKDYYDIRENYEKLPTKSRQQQQTGTHQPKDHQARQLPLLSATAQEIAFKLEVLEGLDNRVFPAPVASLSEHDLPALLQSIQQLLNQFESDGSNQADWLYNELKQQLPRVITAQKWFKNSAVVAQLNLALENFQNKIEGATVKNKDLIYLLQYYGKRPGSIIGTAYFQYRFEHIASMILTFIPESEVRHKLLQDAKDKGISISIYPPQTFSYDEISYFIERCQHALINTAQAGKFYPPLVNATYYFMLRLTRFETMINADSSIRETFTRFVSVPFGAPSVVGED